MSSSLALALVLSFEAAHLSSARAACVGDCDADGTVAVSEAIAGVNSRSATPSCLPAPRSTATTTSPRSARF